MGKLDLPAYQDVTAPDFAQESRSDVDPDFGGPSSAADPLLGPSPPTYHDITTANPTPEFKHIKGRCLTAPPPILSNDLTTNPAALKSFLLEETAAAPHPLLTVTGTHTERVTNSGNNTRENRTVTDFALTFSLYQFMSSSPGNPAIVPPETKSFRGTRTLCTQAHGGALPNTELDIGYQIRAFTGSSNYLKTFTFTKRLAIDETYIREHLMRIIRATNYRGNIAINFPCEGGTKVVARDHWVNQVRYGGWRWAFYISMLWVLVWPVLWALTLRWQTAELVWRQRNGEGAERLWVVEYGQAVGALARSRSKGAVTEAELRGLNEALSRPGGAVQGVEPRGITAAIGGFVRGIREASESVQGGWGGDEGGGSWNRGGWKFGNRWSGDNRDIQD